MNVVCFGDCGIDYYVPCGERRVGGISANVARHARRAFPAGDRVLLVSAVGDDEGGRQVLDELADSGLECHIATLPGITPVQTIEIEPDGERRFVHYETGVLRELRLDDAERALIARSDLLVAPVFLQIVGLFDELMSIPVQGQIAVDFADYLQHPDLGALERHVDRIDIGFFGLTADDRVMIDSIERLARRHGKLFVVTLGPGGSIAFHGHERFECAAVEAEAVVDTTGAGDAFAAAFLARYCQGGSIAAALSDGSALAATVIAGHGAWNSY